ncbi:hypothetical protein PHBOTO_002802, partial [Pseudozyma hubeiensis]
TSPDIISCRSTMTRVNFILHVPTLLLLMTTSVMSYLIHPETVIWHGGQTIEEGVANLNQRIMQAMHSNPSAAAPSADAARNFFNHWNERGRFSKSIAQA